MGMIKSRAVDILLRAVGDSGRMDQDVLKASGIASPNYLSLLRNGRVSSPGVVGLERMLAELGLQLTVEAIDQYSVDPLVRAPGKHHYAVRDSAGYVVPEALVGEWHRLRRRGHKPESVGYIMGLARREKESS